MSKLLLVDDDIELTELLSTLLELEGFDVEHKIRLEKAL